MKAEVAKTGEVASSDVTLLALPRLGGPSGKAHVLERKDAALIAMLALDGPTQRDHVAGLLWPDATDEQQRRNLRQRLFRLRRNAATDVVIGVATLELTSHLTTDLRDLRSRLAGDAQAAQGELLGVLDFTDCESLNEWVRSARQRWRISRLELLSQLASAHEIAHQIAAALAYAQRITQDEPLLEHAHRRLMRLHYLRGDRAAALDAYDRCRQVLRHELGMTPDLETASLAELIERSGKLPQAAPAPVPVTMLRPPRLVGREDAWRTIDSAVRHGRLVVVEAEPGLGKTRLLADFVAASEGAVMLKALPGDERMPYALLARLIESTSERFGLPLGAREMGSPLASILPSASSTSSQSLEPLRLRQAVAAVLDHWRVNGLQLLVIDDLHHADTASVELLSALMSASRERGLRWVLTTRPGEAPRAFADWLEAQDADGIDRVLLPLLNVKQLEDLLASLQIAEVDALRWAAPFKKHTDGNPLFVLETVIALVERGPLAIDDNEAALPLPARLAHQLDRRLAQLSPPAMKLARVAAIAGQDFSVELAAAVMGAHPLDIVDIWAELERLSILRDGGFAHDLIADAARRSMPEAIAIAVHRSVAEHLQATRPEPARLAAHWEAAREWRLAAEAFTASAVAAAKCSDVKEQQLALEAAVRCWRCKGEATDLRQAFDSEWQAGHVGLPFESIEAALERAHALLKIANEPAQRAAALELRSRIFSERYELDAALADAQTAKRLALEGGAPRLRLLAAQREASALMRLSRPLEAVHAQQQLAHEVHLLSDVERLYWFAEHASALDYADRRSESIELFDRTIDIAVSLGSWGAANEAACNKVSACMYMNRLADSARAAVEAIDYGKRAGLDGADVLIDRMNHAGALRDLGHFDDYLNVAEPLPAAFRERGYPVWAANAENDLAIGYLWLGRPDLARQVLSLLDERVPPMMRAARLFTLARLLRAKVPGLGVTDPAQLVREAHALISGVHGAGRSYVRLKIALEVLYDEAPARALAGIEAIEREALETQQLMLATHALKARTELLVKTGDTEAAAEAAMALMSRVAHDGPSPGLYAPDLWWAAHGALKVGHRPLADEALRLARDWIVGTSAHHMPAGFRASFLERNAINRAVLNAAVALPARG